MDPPQECSFGFGEPTTITTESGTKGIFQDEYPRYRLSSVDKQTTERTRACWLHLPCFRSGRLRVHGMTVSIWSNLVHGRRGHSATFFLWFDHNGRLRFHCLSVKVKSIFKFVFPKLENPQHSNSNAQHPPWRPPVLPSLAWPNRDQGALSTLSRSSHMLLQCWNRICSICSCY